MEKALEMTDIEVVLVPKEETIKENLQLDKKFVYGSLNQKRYLKDFSDAIALATGVSAPDMDVRDEKSTEDDDWFRF